VLLSRKERVVCYTSAGISTSADIPDIFFLREKRVGKWESRGGGGGS
jgi:NAD-dependent SIR2 family protein deacetylase